MFEIIKYNEKYENELMELIKAQGDDWKVYWEEPNASLYRKSFSQCITFLALCDGKVCGYSRSIKDALYVYVCDLLVDEKQRGHGLGKKLMECIETECPGLPIYIMSGNDEYYSKINAKREGSIYLFK